jgi:hypothetical protein
MPDKSKFSSGALGIELADALDRSLQTSLDSLDSLRAAVRIYTRDGQNNGLSVDSVCAAVLKALTEAEDGRGHPQSSHDTDLARQIEQWCREGFRYSN